jgi:periplasmic divalent cation tolerance protein
MEFRFVYMTVRDRAEARAIGTALVEERLAACANIIDSMESIYHWEGRLVEDQEAVLIVKTSEAQLPRLIARARALHSYQCPCIVALPIVNGYEGYLGWLAANTAAG